MEKDVQNIGIYTCCRHDHFCFENEVQYTMTTLLDLSEFFSIDFRVNAMC